MMMNHSTAISGASTTLLDASITTSGVELHPESLKYLVICRVGFGSLHDMWIGNPSTRSYDVWLDAVSYDCKPSDLTHSRLSVGPNTTKWPRMAQLAVERPEIFTYDAVWFPDDDLNVTSDKIDSLFALFRDLALDLAQPALAPFSYYSHFITLQQKSFIARYSNFVEVMAPIFSREALRRCIASFADNSSGWGLDYLWPKIIGEGRSQIAILDSIPVIHTRPQGTGTWYIDLPNSPKDDLLRVAQKYNVILPYKYRLYGAVVDRLGMQKVTGWNYFLRSLFAMPRFTMWRVGAWRTLVKALWFGR